MRAYLFPNHKSLFLLLRFRLSFVVLHPSRNGNRKAFSSGIETKRMIKKSESHVVLCVNWEGRQAKSFVFPLFFFFFCFSFHENETGGRWEKKSTRNLYSEIVFMFAIIISNGYVCAPYTSGWKSSSSSPPLRYLLKRRRRIERKAGNIGFFIRW